MCMEPAGDLVAIGFESGDICWVGTTDGIPLQKISIHTQPILAMAFSNLGGRFASASDDRIARIRRGISADDQDVIRLPHEGAVQTLAFSPVEAKIATAAEDGMIRIWDQNNGKLLNSFRMRATGRTRIAYSSDGRRLLILAGGVIGVYNPNNSNQVMELNAMPNDATCLAMNRKESLIAVANEKGEIVVSYYRPDPLAGN